MASDPIVATSGLTKRYGADAGVFDIELVVPDGKIVGLIGPSGSGKTTTIRLLTGLLVPDTGDVRVLGEEPVSFTAQTRARIGYMPQDSVYYPDLTLRENLNFAASLYGMPYRRHHRIGEVIEFLDLGAAAGRLLRDASGGEKRRLSLAATLIHDPGLLFLDEPTVGVDPVLRRRVWDHFEYLAGGGATLLVTTQYVGEAAYCDYVGVLAAGRIIALETPEDLRRLAFGGELLDVEFATAPHHEDVASLGERPEVRSLTWRDPRSVRLSVGDAGGAAPQIVDWAQSRSVELVKTEPYLPPFDDVFVELVAALDREEDRETIANAS